MELRQPPPAQDPALEAVELQLQLEQGFLGGKILSAALMPHGFLGGVCLPQPPPMPPSKGVSVSLRGQTWAGGEEGTWDPGWGGRSTEPREVQRGMLEWGSIARSLSPRPAPRTPLSKC